MTTTPLVSIIIPTYNSRDYLPSALMSCLDQTYPHIEILIVDDGSTDGTGEMVRTQYGNRYGSRIRFIWQENAGPSAARNRGIQAARGEFVQFCDADDMLLPDKIARCMEVFQQQPEVALVYTRMLVVGADGETPVELKEQPLLIGDVFCDLLRNNANVVQPSTMLVRRDALLAVGMFADIPELRCAEDWELTLRLADRYPFAALDERLIKYRHHPASLSRNTYCNTLGRLTAVQRARHLSKRIACLDDVSFDRLEATRHHAYAAVLWQLGRRRAARQAFQQAARLDPAHNKLRRLYALLCLVLPFAASRPIERLITTVKGAAGR